MANYISATRTHYVGTGECAYRLVPSRSFISPDPARSCKLDLGVVTLMFHVLGERFELREIP
jgi:hypothetical protein